MVTVRESCLSFCIVRVSPPAGTVYNKISPCLKSLIQRVSEAERKVTSDKKTSLDHKVRKPGLAE